MSRCSKRGFTLIELIVAIVVISVGLVGILSVYNVAVRGSADPMVRKQMASIAEGLLEEVTLQPFTYCDPTDANVTTANTTADCATTAEAIGPEAGQTRYGPTFFNNVNDYNGFSMNGIRPLDDGATVIPSLSGYTASVAVSNAGSAFSVANDAVLRVDVTVTHGGESFILTGYRFRYAPNSP